MVRTLFFTRRTATKRNEIKVGEVYKAKVSNRVVEVRIDSINTHGGWNATNIATGKRIHIKGPQRLRCKAQGGRAKAEQQADAAAPAAETKAKKGKKVDGEKKTKRTSALDAAAHMLKNASQPMRAQEMIAAMAEQGLWQSPGGNTPHATLYAAIIREIRDKGSEARFRKTDRGQFEFNGA